MLEVVKNNKAISDVDLLNEVKRRFPEVTMSDLNNVLLRLEILGFITVTRMAKDVKRIEYKESSQQNALQ